MTDVLLLAGLLGLGSPLLSQGPAPVRADQPLDPLPPGAVLRLGTLRLRQVGSFGSVRFSPTGQWLAFTQDDNVYVPGALEQVLDTLARSPSSPVPHLFRVLTRFGFEVWMRAGRLREGEIDADCIVVPNDQGKLGRWGMRYQGDWDFILETTTLWGVEPRWCDLVIAAHGSVEQFELELISAVRRDAAVLQFPLIIKSARLRADGAVAAEK